SRRQHPLPGGRSGARARLPAAPPGPGSTRCTRCRSPPPWPPRSARRSSRTPERWTVMPGEGGVPWPAAALPPGARSCRRRPRSTSSSPSCASFSPGLGFARRAMPCDFASLPANTHVIIASMQWDDVRLFLALCRARTVGGAGRTLGVDASTVSRRLGALEESLAATLFDRGREGIAPTEAAERLLPVAEEIEAAMTRFTTAAEGLEREVSGRVRITCPPDVAEVVLVPLLPGLLERHPGLSLEIDPGEAT